MSRDTGKPAECEPYREDLAEVALGIASGRRRGEVLRHAEHCPSCSAELQRSSDAADALLVLAPDIEPPLGFESRLAGRLQAAEQPRRPDRPRRAGVLALAAVLVAVLGFAMGLVASNHAGTSPSQEARSRPTEAMLSSNGQVVGSVILTAGSPASLIMTIDHGWWSGGVTCEAILTRGRVERIGTFATAGDYSTWGAPLAAPAGQVLGARLVNATGVILASASLRT